MSQTIAQLSVKAIKFVASVLLGLLVLMTEPRYCVEDYYDGALDI